MCVCYVNFGSVSLHDGIFSIINNCTFENINAHKNVIKHQHLFTVCVVSFNDYVFFYVKILEVCQKQCAKYFLPFCMVMNKENHNELKRHGKG